MTSAVANWTRSSRQSIRVKFAFATAASDRYVCVEPVSIRASTKAAVAIRSGTTGRVPGRAARIMGGEVVDSPAEKNDWRDSRY
jgi:hypothetical protein